MRRFISAVALASCIACVPAPIPLSPAHSGTAVDASVDETWTAAMDLLVERSIPLKLFDRASGNIILEPQALSFASRRLADSVTKLIADCGVFRGSHALAHPTLSETRLTIRGDSMRSSVTATIRYWRTGVSRAVTIDGTEITEECASTGGAESLIESQIGLKANAAATVRRLLLRRPGFAMRS